MKIQIIETLSGEDKKISFADDKGRSIMDFASVRQIITSAFTYTGEVAKDLRLVNARRINDFQFLINSKQATKTTFGKYVKDIIIAGNPNIILNKKEKEDFYFFTCDKIDSKAGIQPVMTEMEELDAEEKKKYKETMNSPDQRKFYRDTSTEDFYYDLDNAVELDFSYVDEDTKESKTESRYFVDLVPYNNEKVEFLYSYEGGELSVQQTTLSRGGGGFKRTDAPLGYIWFGDKGEGKGQELGKALGLLEVDEKGVVLWLGSLENEVKLRQEGLSENEGSVSTIYIKYNDKQHYKTNTPIVRSDITTQVTGSGGSLISYYKELPKGERIVSPKDIAKLTGLELQKYPSASSYYRVIKTKDGEEPVELYNLSPASPRPPRIPGKVEDTVPLLQRNGSGVGVLVADFKLSPFKKESRLFEYLDSGLTFDETGDPPKKKLKGSKEGVIYRFLKRVRLFPVKYGSGEREDTGQKVWEQVDDNPPGKQNIIKKHINAWKKARGDTADTSGTFPATIYADYIIELSCKYAFQAIKESKKAEVDYTYDKLITTLSNVDAADGSDDKKAYDDFNLLMRQGDLENSANQKARRYWLQLSPTHQQNYMKWLKSLARDENKGSSKEWLEDAKYEVILLEKLTSKYVPEFVGTAQEWCHLYGHARGGPDILYNFVSGSHYCNTEQLAIEMGLGRVQARGLIRGTVEAYKLGDTEIANWMRYKIFCRKDNKSEYVKIFDHIYDGQLESFDKNEYNILEATVRRVISQALSKEDEYKAYVARKIAAITKKQTA